MGITVTAIAPITIPNAERSESDHPPNSQSLPLVAGTDASCRASLRPLPCGFVLTHLSP